VGSGVRCVCALRGRVGNRRSSNKSLRDSLGNLVRYCYELSLSVPLKMVCGFVLCRRNLESVCVVDDWPLRGV